MAPRKRITARDALREAYDHKPADDAAAMRAAAATMVRDGHDREIAQAAVIAAYNSHFKLHTGG